MSSNALCVCGAYLDLMLIDLESSCETKQHSLCD